MNFKEIYEKGISNARKQIIQSSHFTTKPIMTTGILPPGSTICIQPAFDLNFEVDQKGMEKLIAMLEDKWNSTSENERKNLLSILTNIYSISDDYLGGLGIPSKRKNAYFHKKDGCLSLSEIESKNIGLCAERSVIGHQLLSILQQANIINYESYLINSHLTIDGKKETTIEPHSFIILKHKHDSSKQFIFDIENPIYYKISDNDTPVPGVALYPITEEEYESFKVGKSISPHSIFEQFGMSIVGDQRLYGDEKIIQFVD